MIDYAKTGMSQAMLKTGAAYKGSSASTPHYLLNGGGEYLTEDLAVPEGLSGEPSLFFVRPNHRDYPSAFDAPSRRMNDHTPESIFKGWYPRAVEMRDQLARLTLDNYRTHKAAAGQEELPHEEQRIQDRISAIGRFAFALSEQWASTAHQDRPPFAQFAGKLFRDDQRIREKAQTGGLTLEDINQLYWGQSTPPDLPILSDQQQILFHLIFPMINVLELGHAGHTTITNRKIFNAVVTSTTLRAVAQLLGEEVDPREFYDEEAALELIRRLREAVGLHHLRVLNSQGHAVRLQVPQGLALFGRVLEEGDSEIIPVYPKNSSAPLLIASKQGGGVQLRMKQSALADLLEQKVWFAVSAAGDITFVDEEALTQSEAASELWSHPWTNTDDLLGPEQAGQEEQIRGVLQGLPRTDTGAIHLIGPGLARQYPGLSVLAGLEEGVMIAEHDIDQTLVHLIGQDVRAVFVYGLGEWTGRFKVQAQQALVSVVDTYVAGQAAFTRVLQRLLSNVSGLLPKTVAERVDLERLAGWLDELA